MELKASLPNSENENVERCTCTYVCVFVSVIAHDVFTFSIPHGFSRRYLEFGAILFELLSPSSSGKPSSHSIDLLK